MKTGIVKTPEDMEQIYTMLAKILEETGNLKEIHPSVNPMDIHSAHERLNSGVCDLMSQRSKVQFLASACADCKVENDILCTLINLVYMIVAVPVMNLFTSKKQQQNFSNAAYYDFCLVILSFSFWIHCTKLHLEIFCNLILKLQKIIQPPKIIWAAEDEDCSHSLQCVFSS